MGSPRRTAQALDVRDNALEALPSEVSVQRGRGRQQPGMAREALTALRLPSLAARAGGPPGGAARTRGRLQQAHVPPGRHPAPSRHTVRQTYGAGKGVVLLSREAVTQLGRRRRRTLGLSANRIRSLPLGMLSAMPLLEELRLDGNPLVQRGG